MSTIKPLAEVERMVTVAGGYGGVRIGGPKGPTWGVNGGLFDRSHDPPAAAVAESLAHDINEAHWQALAPFRNALARAHNALLDVATVFENSRRAESKGAARYDAAFLEALIRPIVDEAARAINDAQPGEWVPAERLKECHAVLDDLRQEKADVWRERCERAVAQLRRTNPNGGSWVKTLPVIAILEGRAELSPPIARDASPYGLGHVEHDEGEP